MNRRYAQPWGSPPPATIVSPAPASEILYPTYPGVEELGFIYEEPYRPIKASQAPPQRVPAARMKLSPDPSVWGYIAAFGIGFILGWPLGREMLRTGLRMTQAEISRRLAEVKAARGL